MLYSSSGKIKRASAPKSRNGCQTCKARRVKCDEQHPACKTCLKSNRDCTWKQNKPKSQRILIPQNADQLSQTRPSETLLFIDPREASYFKAYQEDAAPELSGLLRSSVWSYTILQACYQEPFVLRAVVAVGALNKAIKTEYMVSISSPSTKESTQALAQQHRAFALASYDRAILGMKQIMPEPKKCSSLRKALLACLLVYCMEIFLQSPNTAFYQTQAGYSLLQEWISQKSQRNLGIQSPDSTVIEDDIFYEFARTDLQHAIRWGERDLIRHSTRRQEGTLTIKNMPTRFTDLEEARVYQELLMRRTFHLIGETLARIMLAKTEIRHPFTTDTPGELVDPCSIPKTLLPERDQYISDIHRWYNAFTPIFAKLLRSPDPLISSSAALLRLLLLNAEIRLAGTFFVLETDFDAYLPHFAEIVSLSKHVAAKQTQLYPKNQPAFLFPDTIDRPLCDVALTCRDLPTRHEALSILRSTAHRDPTRNQARMVTRASFLVSLEEADRLPDGSLPERKRWRLIWVLNHYREEKKHLTLIAARRIGFPVGENYPAKREYARRTFTQEEAEEMECGAWDEGMHFAAWPPRATLRMPRPLQWRGIFDQLTGNEGRRSRLG
ncbi:uncharacterized protein LY89DRAFT_681114 [Mollisia scopiformis]|uniref:Zn(2)-C6 fungal-type domain-containing protein n=1 Tax=Mollisia scopiformis TaxID=149040 RepID=A0A194XNF3_MOLSC|nr:uncharacterized protein LY89DRAFT_681114 [Mollisia scopiformis]KUJ21681.1 hypothetical protein LY89DRAFT_681114 [Mollisia scopiformis]